MSDTTTTLHPALRSIHGLSDPARQILEQRHYAVLGTQNADGTSHLVPVMFLFLGAQILIETNVGTRKASNVAANGRAVVLVQTPDAAWVSGSGPAEIIRGRPSVRLNERIRAKYLTATGERACGDLLAELDDVTIAVTPTTWLSWDLTAFMETLAGRGVDLSRVAEWFRED